MDANDLAKITDFVTNFASTRRRRGQDASLPANDDAAAEDESDDDDESLDEHMDSLDVDDSRSKSKYMRIMRKVANRQTTKVVIDLNDLQEYSSDDRSLLHNIMSNTRRYIQLFANVLDNLKPEPDHEADHADDVLDIIMQQRLKWNQAQIDQGIPVDVSGAQFPPDLMRRL